MTGKTKKPSDSMIKGPFWEYRVDYRENPSGWKMFQEGSINEPISHDQALKMLHDHFSKVIILKISLTDLLEQSKNSVQHEVSSGLSNRPNL